MIGAYPALVWCQATLKPLSNQQNKVPTLPKATIGAALPNRGAIYLFKMPPLYLNLVYIRSSALTRDAPRTKWIPLMKTYEMNGHSNHDKSYNVPNETMTKKHPQTWTCQKSRSSIQLPVQMVAGEPHTYKHITGTLLSTSLKTTWFPLEIQWLMTHDNLISKHLLPTSSNKHCGTQPTLAIEHGFKGY